MRFVITIISINEYERELSSYGLYSKDFWCMANFAH